MGKCGFSLGPQCRFPGPLLEPVSMLSPLPPLPHPYPSWGSRQQNVSDALITGPLLSLSLVFPFPLYPTHLEPCSPGFVHTYTDWVDTRHQWPAIAQLSKNIFALMGSFRVLRGPNPPGFLPKAVRCALLG